MNLEKLNSWLTLIANFGVLAGVIFLAMEIRQNNLLLQLETTVSEQATISGQFVNSEYLPQIYDKVLDAQGIEEPFRGYIDEFDLSEEEAARWHRYINQIWRQFEANWQALGNPEELCINLVEQLESRRDHEIFWENGKQGFTNEFTACIDGAR